MNNLNSILEFAKKNMSNAIDINSNHPKKPSNVYLFNHAIPGGSEEALMIDKKIIWFPNIKSIYGAIIKGPKEQYIFCNEIFDCVGIGGTLRDEKGNKHIFGTHVYESILKYQMMGLVKEIYKHNLTPEKVIYSPREDTSDWEKGLKILEENFFKTTNVLREKNNEAEMILGQEGLLLNNIFYRF